MSVPQIQQLIQRGMTYARQKQFPQAIKAFTQALELDTQNAKAYFYRGLCWAELKKYSHAEKDLTQALRFEGKNANAAYHLGVLLARRKETEKALWCFSKAEQLGHPQAAEQATKQQLRLQGQKPPHEAPPQVEQQTNALFEKASKLMAQGAWDDALTEFARLLSLDENNWPAYSNRGVIYLYKGEPDKAAVEYEQAIALAPEQATIYVNRTRAYLKMKQLEPALADANHILEKLRPNRNVALAARVLRARILREMGEFHRAETDLAAAQKLGSYETAVYDEWGQLHLVQHKIPEAIEMFQQALSHDGEFVDAHYHLGTAHMIQGDYAAAIQSFSRAIALAPDTPEYYVDRGAAYGRLQKTKNEIADFQKAIDLRPDYAMAHYNMGNTSYNQGEFEEAIAHLNHVIELDENYLEAYTTRGSCYLRLGRPGDALMDYRAALRINPQDQVTRQNLFGVLQDYQPEDIEKLAMRGALYAEMHAFEQAITDFNEVIQQDRQYSEAYRERGLAYMQLGQADAAVQDFSRALRDDPYDFVILINRSNIYLTEGQFDRALRDAEKALSSAPDEPKVSHAVANALAKLERYNEAIPFYSQAIELAGDDPEAALSFNSRGIAYSYMGNDDQALQDYQQAIQYMPEHSKAHYNIGGILASQGQYGPAFEAFTRAEELGYAPASQARADMQTQVDLTMREKEADLAIQQNPQEATPYAERALIYAQSGRLDEAAGDIERALKLDKRQAPAYVAQAIVLENQGQTNQALASLKNAIKYDKRYGLAYVMQANLYKRHDKINEALAAYKAAIKAGVEDGRPAYSLGNYYLHQGDLEEARPYLEKAIEIDANMGDAYFDLGSVYGRLGDAERALACYERSAELGDTEAAQIAAGLRQRQDAPLGFLDDEPLGAATPYPPSTDDLVQMAAQLLAEFAQHQCGNRLETRIQSKKGLFGRVKQEQVEVVKWRVVVEELSLLDKSGYLGEYLGATLELPQRPEATVRLSVMEGTYFRLMIMAEIKVPGVDQQTSMVVTKEDVEADSRQVQVRLYNLLQDGYLAVKNGRLVYTGKRP